MKNDKYFDEILKCELKDSAEEATPSRDIFNEAWNSRERYSESYDKKIESMYFYMDKKKIAALILGAFMSIAVLSFGISPSVRAAVKTIFDIDNEGNIVEKSEDDLENVNSTMAAIDDSNREEIEKMLGFKIKYPEEVGNCVTASNDVLSISVKNVKYRDSDNILDRIQKATDYNELYKELNKEYDVELFVSQSYCEKGNDEGKIFIVGQNYGGEAKVSSRWKLKDERNIQGIECKVMEEVSTVGTEVVDRGEDGIIKGIKDDVTIKPTGTEKSQEVIFSYNNIVYSFMGFDKDDEKNEADEIAFVEEYIKLLKNE